jgi:NADPH:quinone reductase-like Zn-dependent oxidoreductase
MLAGLRSDETLLIHGGTSGIGTMAIQLAHDLGAQVVVTCGTRDKVDAALSLGADHGIDYRQQDFVEEIARITDGRGADVILDVIGAKYLARNIDALAFNGRLVVIGLQGGTKAELDLNRLLTKRGAILATSLRGRPDEEKAAIVASVRAHVWPLIEAGSIAPVIDRVLPITEVGRAHDVIEAGGHVGKIVLAVA